jgi:23S rRNA pseudouridine1911/1915/1917 synthase
MGREDLIATEGRLDAVVATLTGAPRADVQRAIEAGTVLVDGATRPKAYRLRGGERLSIELPGDEPLAAESPGVPVRYEDADVLVVAKPAGLVTHPTEAHRGGSLVNRLLGMGVELAPAGGALRPGIVHRLDAGTSGLVLVAKTDRAYDALRGLFRTHAVDRRYVALVRGSVADDVFDVDAPLGRRAARVVVDRAEGRAAETAFSVLERLPRSTLVEAVPRTGRTHQIRVHLAAIGHPILGDRAYGGAGGEATALGLVRPFLHARGLAFEHPFTGERVVIEEPLPDELVGVLDRARHLRS